MLIVAREVTINFDTIHYMEVENKFLKFDYGDYYFDILLNSSEEAHQAPHGEKVCKI